jgi:hypothetical protein
LAAEIHGYSYDNYQDHLAARGESTIGRVLGAAGADARRRDAGDAGTSSRSANEADVLAALEPEGRIGFAGNLGVARRRRCPCIASSSRLDLARKSYARGLLYFHHGLLGVNLRFDRYMPEAVATLESAADEAWPIEKVASALGVEINEAKEALLALERARKVVDAENPGESFRWAVRQSIEAAIEEGLSDSESINRLTIQICYRAADLGYILKQNGEVLSQYSRHLRSEPGVEYHEGYFDKEE